MLCDEEVQNDCDLMKADEFEVLQSMFEETELQLLPSLDSSALSSNLVFKKTYEEVKLQAHFNLPSLYPIKEYPTVFFDSNGILNDRLLNEKLREWLRSLEKGMPLIAEIIMWLNDFIPNCPRLHSNEATDTSFESEPELYSRYFIYSHHLYSSTKRSDIVRLTKNLNLNGFSTPGKPAIIIVEGKTSNCRSFYNEIKSWNWQRLILRITDDELTIDDLKFSEFREVNAAGCNNKHVNTSEIRKIMENIGLLDRFEELYNL